MSRGPNRGGLTFVPIKENQIRRMWADHKQMLQSFKDHCFDLLAHPDATDEEVEDVRRAAIDMKTRHYEMLNLLRSHGFNVD